MVKTLTRSITMHVTDENHIDSDKYAKRLTFVINAAQDHGISGDTQFYLIHGWDPQSALKSTLPLVVVKRKPKSTQMAIQYTVSISTCKGGGQ